MIALSQRAATLGAAIVLPLMLAACEPGPKDSVQWGPRGAGMEQVTARGGAQPAAPPPSMYALETREGQKAREVYPDLQVLGDISIDEFGLLMANITEWVVPKDAPESEAGCNYCHNPDNMASDEKYTKVVSRAMLRMTRTINVNWADHVKETGVTCYTCHRGKAVPEYSWTAMAPARTDTILGNRHGQNAPAKSVGFSSLPNDPNANFTGSREIRVNSPQIYPGGTTANIHDAEATYGLMMRISDALGVNCTFCHNTHNLAHWGASRVQKQTAWYGIRMARDINDAHIQPLAGVFPTNAGRLGPMGDPLKVNCQTCHQGQQKPLGGVSMLADNPALREVHETPAPAPVVVAGVARTTEGAVAAVAALPAETAEAIAGRVNTIRAQAAAR